MAPPRRVFTVTLTQARGQSVPAVIALRRLLKCLGRVYGLRALEVGELRPRGANACPHCGSTTPAETAVAEVPGSTPNLT